jgi:hypothetical protein
MPRRLAGPPHLYAPEGVCVVSPNAKAPASMCLIMACLVRTPPVSVGNKGTAYPKLIASWYLERTRSICARRAHPAERGC